MSASPTIELAQQLIKRPSVTPADEGCQQLMAERLEALGFVCESLRFEDVDNLWAVRGESGPLLVFAGHTDVVPTGDSRNWEHAPYSALVKDGMLHGRGAADMKGSLAAMITACEAAVAKAHPSLDTLRLGFLITSDEEGIAANGTRRVIDTLVSRGEQINYCVVGEPSSNAAVGDTIRIGRRGSLSAALTIFGKQGHVAYPHLADNPIHRAMPALAELSAVTWDSGNDAFPPTTLQISNIAGGTGANNVIPGACKIEFNFRFSTESTHEGLIAKTTELFDAHALDYKIDWHLSGEPFLTKPGLLRNAVAASIEEITGLKTEQSTAGGTSDGRFIAPTGAEVVELGPCNATIHQVNECISTADLETLALIYERLIERIAEGANA
jgi:succinyl-diaminopimelate desuccinylase